LRGRLEDDAVGVLAAGGDGGDGGQRGAVEDHNGIAAAVGDVAELAGVVKGDAVGSVQASDSANLLACGGVKNQNLGSSGDVELVYG